MANSSLVPVYKILFDEDFDYQEFDNRMKMQKSVYLLTEMGVPVGNYGFRWYLHGPYSQDLHDDMYYENGRPVSDIKIFQDYDKRIDKLRAVIHSDKKGTYSVSNWMECVASIRYIRDNVLPFDAAMEDVLAELSKRKKHLSQKTVNETAYKMVEELFRYDNTN